MTMDKELKAKWVKALRSGEFEQGQNELEGPGNRFCCLGVLCSLEAKPTTGSGISFSYRWAGERVGSRAYSKLIDMNDNLCLSFSEIADYIEADL